MVLVFVSVVIAPDNVMVNISLVVVTVEVSKFVSEVILNMLNILDSVVRGFVGSEMVSTVNVVMFLAYIVVFVSMVIIEIMSVVVVVMFVEVNTVAIVMVGAFC